MQQEMVDELAKSPDCFQDNKPSEKAETKYTTTRIKSRDFLSNIWYVGINIEDFYNNFYNFIFDVCCNKKYKFIFTDRKLDDQNKHKMIYMHWKESMPQGSARKRIFFTLTV